jgi:hypothetical protein
MSFFKNINSISHNHEGDGYELWQIEDDLKDCQSYKNVAWKAMKEIKDEKIQELAEQLFSQSMILEENLRRKQRRLI